MKMKTDHSCLVLCEAEFDKKDLKTLVDRIKEDYNVHLIADSLPAHLL